MLGGSYGSQTQDAAIGVQTSHAHEYRGHDRRRLHDLPAFSGLPEEWPMFFNAYQVTTEAYGYTDLENLLRLQKCLTGDAKTSVSSVLIHPRHVGRAVASLELKFGHPHALVRSQIKLAKELPVIDEDHQEQLISFATCVQNVATFLDTPSTQCHLRSPELLEELTRKLPTERRIGWGRVAIRLVEPSVMDLAQWLTEEARLLEFLTPATSAKPPSKTKHVLLNAVLSDTDESPVKCSYCSEAHATTKCVDFLSLAIDERWREVSRLSLCFACLGSGHILPSCQCKLQCGIDGCERWHHRQLHSLKKVERPADSDVREPPVRTRRTRKLPQKPSRKEPTKNDSSQLAPSDRQSVTTAASVETKTDSAVPVAMVPAAVTLVKSREWVPDCTLLFRVVPVVLHGRNRNVQTHALLDEGSSITLMDADLADDLELEGPSSELNVQWFSAGSTLAGSRKVAVDISGQQDKNERFELTNVRTVKNLTLPIQTVDTAALRRTCPHLRHLPIDDYVNARPKILIGLDHHHLGVPLDVRVGEKQLGIVAARTVLGWVVYGCSDQTLSPKPIVLHVDSLNEEERRLDEMMRSYFSTEDFGVKVLNTVIESDDDKRARKILKETTCRIGRRFETGLLWRNDNTNLPDNYDMAVRRLCGVESKMRRDPNYAALYNAQIKSYVEKGYARMLSGDEARVRSGRTWYLPHFAVINPNKPGKFRMVFDAAAQFRGVSLNTELLSGPDFNVPLARLMLQFRIGLVGVCADVREMYHQVQVRKADQDAQRFLWRGGDSTMPPSVYVMTAMTFGSTCSPASAQHVKNLNAVEFASEFPEAEVAIRTKHYVDDFVASFDTPEEAAKISAEVVEVHSRGGFELRGFVSNSRTVLEKLGVETGPGEPVCMQMDLNAMEKVLGMCWDTNDDTFVYRTRFPRVRREVMTGASCPTKREILSASMSVFDPFGFLADFMLESKIILQDLWRLGVDWDKPVPEPIEKRWNEWRAEIDSTRTLKVPRCYTRHLRVSPDVQLHVFADASEAAFAAVAYWRVVHADGVDVSFVLGKTRCAPLQILSVPRLELQAAVLASRMLTEIRRSHDVTITRVVLWSDSETVIKWLQSDQRKYKQFVAFRIAEALEAAPVSCWRWVPTAMNPADDATRVQRPPKFDPDSRWVRGPAWLSQSEDDWPIRAAPMAEDADNDECVEVRRKFVGVAAVNPQLLLDVDRFSHIRQICRIIALVRRFAANSRVNVAHRSFGELGAAEIDGALLAMCRYVQTEGFHDEYTALQDGRQLSASSSIQSLKPYLDHSGLMRVYGRTDAAADDVLPYDARRPILLPRKHRFTVLLVQDQHEKMAHQLVNATIAAVRRRFWVPQVRVLVRSVQKNCVICKKRLARPLAPVQGQLPSDRLTPYERPFTNTGLDFFGPFTITVGRRREKRWVALFTCLAIRAVHLEVAADLTTDACLVCVRNFCHLRGTPSRIRCDNGTNFVGARNELASEDGFIDAEAMQRELATRGIEWTFNCPGNPEAGGVWERLVQSVKRVLQVTLKEEAPRVETLRAHLLEAANMVNSRPLTHLPVTPDEDGPLTPNHFLMGGPNAVTMASPLDAEPGYVRKQWRICRELSRRFWAQWIRDYLPELTRRSKNFPERPELRADDLVIVCDDNQPRGRWSMGRVVSVVVGTDGRVRTAEVKTPHGTYRRPVTKLAALDFETGSTGSPDGARDVGERRPSPSPTV